MPPDDPSADALSSHRCESNYSPKQPNWFENVQNLLVAERTRYSRRPITPFEGDVAASQWLDTHARRLAADRTTADFNAAYAKRNPLVSVCVTTSDRPDVLRRRALAALSRQTYRNLQIVIVGDCCDQRTSDLVAEINDPRSTYTNLPRRGPYPPPGRSRWLVAGTHPANEALRQVKGDFVTHLDEDDTFSECRISDLVQAIVASRSDLVFHPFWWEREDRTWTIIGNGKLELGQVSSSTVLYHRWFAQVPCDLHAYRLDEPGDWNRFKRLAALGARAFYVDHPLAWHWRYPTREPFTPKLDEEFLDQG